MRLFLASLCLLIFSVQPVFARVTPEDIVNEKKAVYQQKVGGYSEDHKRKLEDLSRRVDQINQQRSFELQENVLTQGLILDEFQNRVNSEKTISSSKAKQIEDVRYWITFAHEAISYQKAKIYIYDLIGESAIRNDTLRLINLFSSDLNSTRAKVIKSQKLLENLVKV